MPAHEAARGPHVLRQINTAAVLRALRENSPARLADLVKATGLSRPAVTRAAADLREAGLVVDIDVTQAAMGRPAQLLRFRSEAGHVVGVDVGSRKVLAMASDLAGRVVASRQSRVVGPDPGSGMLAAIRDAISGALTDAGLDAAGLWAITVGSPGIVDDRSGEVVLAPGLPGWAQVPLLAELRASFDCPVLIENDVNLALLAERWCGAAPGSDSLLFVHWGVRIGAGIIIDGRPYRGANAAAGEIGFADVFSPADQVDAASVLGDTEVGPFERAVGARAILDLAGAGSAGTEHADTEHAPAGSWAGESDSSLSQDAVVALFAAAAGGDMAALDLVDRIAARFARGLAVLLLVLDPQEVVIGGGVSRAGQTLLAAVERHLLPRILTRPRLALSDLGGDAVALGAVRRSLDHIEDRLLTQGVT